jgi:hypothetical protein
MAAEARRRLVESVTARLRDIEGRLRGAQFTNAEGEILKREAERVLRQVEWSTRLPDDVDER